MAPASTLHALAELLASEVDGPSSAGYAYRALALLHAALAFVPSSAWHEECTQWPLQGRELSIAFLRLAARVTTPWPARDKALPDALPDARIAVLTSCSNSYSAEVRSQSAANRRAYASRHGYPLYFFEDAAAVAEVAAVAGINASAAATPPYWRALAALGVVASGADLLLWLDCDVLITDLSRPVKELMGAQASLVIGVDGHGIRADAWLLQGNAWGRQLLYSWLAVRPQGLRGPTLSERAALRHAVLPYWAAWHRGGMVEDWSALHWPVDAVQLAGAEFLAEAPPPARAALSRSPAPLKPATPSGESELLGRSAALLSSGSCQGSAARPAVFSSGQSLQRPWQRGDFAWHDPWCAGVVTDTCRQRRAAVLSAIE
eukprot:NODE_11821_length_1263_cov_5.366197.p1 GENE.NODE_11821_length_1263_cov_5.366197~~NODE_11821_length_1263_cov_5.366197.p1  ORF type:complete len:385 (+),score=78.34 NODE_11821_length_1263_cov_5.366197:29-1156(+)